MINFGEKTKEESETTEKARPQMEKEVKDQRGKNLTKENRIKGIDHALACHDLKLSAMLTRCTIGGKDLL